MAVLIDTDEYDDNQLGLTLYRVMALTIDQPEPWVLLGEEDRAYYIRVARDYIRQLARLQGSERRKAKKRLWTFDFTDNKAKVKWFWCPDVAQPTRWIEPYTKRPHTFVLHQDVFLTRMDALTYGLAILAEYAQSVTASVTRVEEALHAASEDTFVDEADKQEWVWFTDEPESEEEA